MSRAATVLTAARAIRAARQYFGHTAKMDSVAVAPAPSPDHAAFTFRSGERAVVIEQREKGTIILTEDGETDTFRLPPIGPIDFKNPLP